MAEYRSGEPQPQAPAAPRKKKPLSIAAAAAEMARLAPKPPVSRAAQPLIAAGGAAPLEGRLAALEERVLIIEASMSSDIDAAIQAAGVDGESAAQMKRRVQQAIAAASERAVREMARGVQVPPAQFGVGAAPQQTPTAPPTSVQVEGGGGL